jgi:2-polyprenyl-3-methyl-5-hydroxy-6-metoxy-1,4-benzoquinol methylase
LITTKENIAAWSKNAEECGTEFYCNYKEAGDFWHQELLNSYILDCLGDVNKLKILDAGCGEGYFSRILAKKGAQVIGLEPSALIDYAKSYEKQESLGIVFLKQDLCTFDNRNVLYDAVIAINVFMDIPDFMSALKNCTRCLKIGGKLVFSVLHPCFHFTLEYFNEQQVKQANDVMTHRMVSTYLNAIADCGLTIKRIFEPQLNSKYEQGEQKTIQACHTPLFLIIEAVKE